MTMDDKATRNVKKEVEEEKGSRKRKKKSRNNIADLSRGWKKRRGEEDNI